MLKTKNLSLKDRWGNPLEGFKLNSKAVERVLTAHNLGMLCRGGMSWRIGMEPKGCILQVVDNEPDRWSAAKSNPAVAGWFDQNYSSNWTTEEFLDAMEKAGIF